MLSPLFWLWLTWWVPFDAEIVVHRADGSTCYFGEFDKTRSPWRRIETCRRPRNE